MENQSFEELSQKSLELYKSNQYVEAMVNFEHLRKMDEVQFEKKLLFYYLWCIYRTAIFRVDAFSNQRHEETQKYIKYILQKSNNKELIYQLTVFRVIKNLKDKVNFDETKFLFWLNLLDPAFLSDKSASYTKDDGKVISYPSQKEDWYAYTTKALEKSGEFVECRRISQEALEVLTEFHNGNEIWFKRRIAISSHKLGETLTGIEILKELLKFKQDWFIYSDIFEMYLALGETKSALDYAVDAVMKPMDDEFKVNLFWMIAELFESIEEIEKAKLLKIYSIKVRLSKEWPLKESIISYYEINQNEIDAYSIFDLKKQIYSIFNTLKWSGKARESGKITRVNVEGKSGFIQANDKSYYFKFGSFKDNKKLIQVGTNVSFYTEESFDKKKNQKSVVAVEIKLS